MTTLHALTQAFRMFFVAELLLAVANAYIWEWSFFEASIVAVGGGLAAIPSAAAVIWCIQRTQWTKARKFLGLLVAITLNTATVCSLCMGIIFHEYGLHYSLPPALCTIAAVCFCFKEPYHH